MFFLLLLGLLAGEILLFIEVGGAIGVWPTLGSILGTALLGGLILRHQGLSTLARARAQLDRHEVPVAAMLEGMALLVTALLLLTPGYITDALGFALLLSPLRRLVLRRAVRLVKVRIARAHGAGSAAPHGEQVIDAEYTDVTPQEPGKQNDKLGPPGRNG
jgi:UPF0716 protein FxsA